MDYKEIFDNSKVIAVYGMSTNMSKPSHTVPMYMKNQGYTIIPINPNADEISGMKCYHTIAEVPDKIDILDVFRRSEDTPEVVKEAIERKYAKDDIKVIWLQEGIKSEISRQLALDNGFEYVEDACMFKEHARINL